MTAYVSLQLKPWAVALLLSVLLGRVGSLSVKPASTKSLDSRDTPSQQQHEKPTRKDATAPGARATGSKQPMTVPDLPLSVLARSFDVKDVEPTLGPFSMLARAFATSEPLVAANSAAMSPTRLPGPTAEKPTWPARVKRRTNELPEATAFLALSEVDVVRGIASAQQQQQQQQQQEQEQEQEQKQVGATVVHATMEGPYLSPGPLRPITAHPAALFWLHYLTIGAIVKGLCMASNVFFQASPYPKVQRFFQEQDVGESDPAPYVAVAFGSAQWVFYGLFAWWTTGTKGFLVVVYANVLGAILGFFYVIVYQQNCRKKTSADSLRIYGRIVAGIVVFQALVILLLPRERALYISGLVSCLCSVAGSASTLATLPKVLKTRSAESIPLEMAVVCMVSGLLWVTCGLMIHDVWLVIPNTIGFLCNVFCVGLVFRFGRQGPHRSLTAQKDGLLPPIPEEEEEDGGARRNRYGACSQHEDYGAAPDIKASETPATGTSSGAFSAVLQYEKTQRRSPSGSGRTISYDCAEEDAAADEVSRPERPKSTSAEKEEESDGAASASSSSPAPGTGGTGETE